VKFETACDIAGPLIIALVIVATIAALTILKI